MSADLIETFVAIGLSEQKAKETLKNDNVTQNLKSAIEQVSCFIASRLDYSSRYIHAMLSDIW